MSDILNMLNTPTFHIYGVFAFMLVGFRTYQILSYHKYYGHVATKVAHIAAMLALSAYLMYVWITPEPVYFQYGIMFPQTEKTDDSLKESADVEKPSNAIEALANGARDGMHLAMNVGAMLIAFVSVIALINWILSSFGGVIGEPDLTLQVILGWIFKPLAYLIGISWEESAIAGQMIGLKLAVNEFVGYLEFAKYLQPDSAVVLSDKTKAIITFALCGFANFSSIAILIGGLGGMAPNRRGDVARLGLKAVLAGSLSNLMSATIAGLFIGLSGAVL